MSDASHSIDDLTQTKHTGREKVLFQNPNALASK